MMGTGGINLSLAKNGDSSGRVAESALPVRVVITELRSGCNKNPNEKRNSSLLASVMTSSGSATSDDAWEGLREAEAEIEAAATGLMGCSRVFERFVDLRGSFGALMLTEMWLSRSARSASRSTRTAGAWMRPLGILIGIGGPLRIEAVRGGVFSSDNILGDTLDTMLEFIGEILRTSGIGDSVKLTVSEITELF